MEDIGNGALIRQLSSGFEALLEQVQRLDARNAELEQFLAQMRTEVSNENRQLSA